MTTQANSTLLDPEKMGEAVANCHAQIIDTLALGKWSPQSVSPFSKILFLGMGGSASGGDFVRIWSEQLSNIPMVILRGYDIPKWVDGETLVVAASYSGNTEEVLSAAEQSQNAGAQIVAITTGGKLTENAQTGDWELHTIPAGFHPRAAIGYSLAALCRVMVGYEVLALTVLDELRLGATRMAELSVLYANRVAEDNVALSIARRLVGKLPVIYGTTGGTEALAIRFRAQLAENSNVFAAQQLLPELNHNEIVGLKDRLSADDETVVIWLSDADDHNRVKLRRKLTSELMGIDGGSRMIEITGSGETLIQRNLTLLATIDWISYYLAVERGVDPSDIEVLLKLKKLMAPGR